MIDHNEKKAREANSFDRITRFNFTPRKQPVTGYALQKELYLGLGYANDFAIPKQEEDNLVSKNPSIERKRSIAAKNFDMNMEFYSNLNYQEYSDALQYFITKYKMREIDDLEEIKDLSGFYLMCLDDYCQFYFAMGIIRKEITKFWYTPCGFSNNPGPNYSLEISNFGIFDTKRIFVNTDRIGEGVLSEEMIDSIRFDFLHIEENKYAMKREPRILVETSTKREAELTPMKKNLFSDEKFKKLAYEFMAGPMTSEDGDYMKLSPEEVHTYLKDGQLVMDEVAGIPQMIKRILGDNGFEQFRRMKL